MNPTETETNTVSELSLVEDNDVDFPQLTRMDRCDACGAAALTVVKVIDDASMIYLCGNHFRRNRAVFDERKYSYLLNDDIRRDVLFELPPIAGANKPYAGTTNP